MAWTVSLAASVSLVLDGNANGTAEIGPALPGEVRYPTAVSMSCTGSQHRQAGRGIPVRGVTGPARTQVDHTDDTLGASSSVISGQKLYAGQAAAAVSSDGPAHQTAALTVDGGRASLRLASSAPRPGPCPRSVLRISVEDHAFRTVR